MPDVGIVLLAAGGSSRMGRPKQLLPVAGESMLRRSASAAVQSGYSPVVVVLGSQADALRHELSGLPITVALNDVWQRGIGSSIRCGMRALLGNDTGVTDVGPRLERRLAISTIQSPGFQLNGAATRTGLGRSSPSPGTPGEGGGEGEFLTHLTQDPHPIPLPEYRARGPDEDSPDLRQAPGEKRERENDLIAAGNHQLVPTPAAMPRTAVIMLCDQPLVTADVVRRLVSAQAHSGKPICVSAFGGTYGPPVVIDSSYFNSLLALPDCQGAKAVWADRREQVHFETCAEAEVDFDTPADYERWILGTGAP